MSKDETELLKDERRIGSRCEYFLSSCLSKRGGGMRAIGIYGMGYSGTWGYLERDGDLRSGWGIVDGRFVASFGVWDMSRRNS